MKSKDQQLLEEAYEEVLLQELNWKGALAAGAMAASGLMGGAGQAKASEVKPYSLDKHSEVYSNWKGNVSGGETTQLKSFTLVLEKSLGKFAGNVLIDVIESKGLDSGDHTVVLEVGGDVVASSQEEADAFIKGKIKEILQQQGISIQGLQTVDGTTYQESEKKTFKTKTRVTVILKKN